MLLQQDHHVSFFTAVCYDWLPLLQSDEPKKIILDALKFRIDKGQMKVSAYVIMPNHIHIIWRIAADIVPSDFQRDFLKFTAKSLLHYYKDCPILDRLKVDKKDRSYQVWKRDLMSIDLYSPHFFRQKLEYIHANPCQPKWMLVDNPFAYRYSFSSFYEEGKDEFNILTHYSDI